MIVVIVTCVICVLFMGLLFSLVSAGEKESLEDQAECIRQNYMEKAEKERRKEEKRQRRRDKWQR